ncbi:MAG: hypothetical protein KatS3mg034_1777 [Vicingaceae bacterium]|nr:MAG: hypothetical protein KatS3mg034_1777 [Vicingaceae bacterium]
MNNINQRFKKLKSKKFLSYFWPIKYKLNTSFNHNLTFYWVDGKPLIDTPNTNMSFGLLQKVLEFGLEQISPFSANNVLLLGLGGGSILEALRNKHNIKGPVTAVDYDTELINFSVEVLNIKRYNPLRIFIKDAFDFLKNCNDQFDLIIMDIFDDLIVPEKFYSTEFCLYLDKHLLKNGYLIYNLGISLKPKGLHKQTVDFFENNKNYQCRYFAKVCEYNQMLIAKKLF